MNIHSNRLPEGCSIQPESIMALMREAIKPKNIPAYQEERVPVPMWLYLAIRTDERRRVATYGTL